MHVFVIIPVHNHIDETLRCLASLERQTHSDRTVIVVDGGSTDGSTERIADRHPAVLVIRGDASLWWTGATALGVDHARVLARPGDFVLFLNNDTQVRPDYLDRLIEVSLSHGRALTGSLNVTLADPPTIIDAGVRWDWQGVRSWQVPMEAGAESTDKVSTLSGRGMLVPVEVFDRIGNVDVRRLPHYAADYEFAMRAARAGFTLALSYRAVVRVNTDITGREGDLATPVGLRDTLYLLFSRRSIRNLWHRLRFVQLACPRQFKLRNYLAILAASGWLLTNVPPLFQLKNGLIRVILPRRLKEWMRARKLIP
jgi:GT2 family glycosyltransferase